MYSSFFLPYEIVGRNQDRLNQNYCIDKINSLVPGTIFDSVGSIYKAVSYCMVFETQLIIDDTGFLKVFWPLRRMMYWLWSGAEFISYIFKNATDEAVTVHSDQ